jgi:hypothetical protein
MATPPGRDFVYKTVSKFIFLFSLQLASAGITESVASVVDEAVTLSSIATAAPAVTSLPAHTLAAAAATTRTQTTTLPASSIQVGPGAYPTKKLQIFVTFYQHSLVKVFFHTHFELIY